MERSIRNIKQILRENVTRFLENADGREVIVNVTARLVKNGNNFFRCGIKLDNVMVNGDDFYSVINMSEKSLGKFTGSEVVNNNREEIVPPIWRLLFLSRFLL
ncbi:hypothetical protein DINM_004875 [Dirofilaria immitis]|nr:hypothetical protein [Dirofilaria immitis]